MTAEEKDQNCKYLAPTVKFCSEFEIDIEDAFDYWVSKQDPEQIKSVTISKWVTSILQKSIYELLGQKRIEDA